MVRRPRSLVGLLLYLIAIKGVCVRRRPALFALGLGALVTIALVARGRTTRTTTIRAMPPLQAAVLADGFAVMEAVGDRHVVEIDRNGVRRRRSAIPTVTDTRVFGWPKGPGVGYIQGKKIHVAPVTGDGTLGRGQSFGTSVREMCYGLASNDQRWAIGWLEEGRDERLWFVHGLTSGATDTASPADSAEVASIALTPHASPSAATRPAWCAVRSANDYIALIYRIEAKTFVLMCTARECGVQTRAPIDPRDEVLDLACQREGCVAALRTREGAAHLIAFNLRGKVTWKKPLAYATRDRVQLQAVGDRAYAVSLMTQEGPVIERLLVKTGSSARAWHGAPGLGVPAITWAKDYAMIAYWDGDALGHDVFAMPR